MNPEIAKITLKKLQKEYKYLGYSGLCDSECEGRCRICPADFVADLMKFAQDLTNSLSRTRKGL